MLQWLLGKQQQEYPTGVSPRRLSCSSASRPSSRAQALQPSHSQAPETSDLISNKVLQIRQVTRSSVSKTASCAQALPPSHSQAPGTSDVLSYKVTNATDKTSN